MKRAFTALAFTALFAAPAFAQGTLEQPGTPDDGVGVDYSQPYLNDLLLRAQPFVDGNSILSGRLVVSCEKQRMALAENPLDPALDQAYELCREQQEKQRKELSDLLREFRAMPPPGARPPLYRPDPGAPRQVRPLPPSPSHPNVQN